MKRKKLLCMCIALSLLLSAVVFWGCTANEDDNAPVDDELAGLSFTTETLPKIDGATALAPYYELMASKLLNVDIEEARQWVLCSKTDGAYRNLINGSVDIIFCSLPSEDQQRMADEAGVEFEMTPFLNGAFVFFVNKSNPIESLTVQQLSFDHIFDQLFFRNISRLGSLLSIVIIKWFSIDIGYNILRRLYWTSIYHGLACH